MTNQEMNHTCYFQSPLGVMEITANEHALTSIKFLEQDMPIENTPPTKKYSLSLAVSQLEKYFEGKLKEFDLPLQLTGTDFQQQVWTEVQKIPFGKTSSYVQLAEKLGSRDLARAVGTANGNNPFWIVIPCHRVVGNTGELVGYAGGLWRKQWLLEHEGCQMLLPFS